MKKTSSTLLLILRNILGGFCTAICAVSILFLLAAIFITENFFKLPDNIALSIIIVFIALLFGFFAYLFFKKPKIKNDSVIPSKQQDVSTHEQAADETLNEDNNMDSSNHSRYNICVMAHQWLRIAEDSEYLVNTTVNPDVFFSRYDLLIKQYTKLSQVENYINLSVKMPSVYLADLETLRDYNTSLFIKRWYSRLKEDVETLKTEKGKKNRLIKNFTKLSTYKYYLSESNIELLKKLSSNDFLY